MIIKEKLTMSIELKRYPISVKHRGTVLRGTIIYWSKDYRVVLEHPVHRESSSLHMMYMIPARFVTPLDATDVKSVRNVDIVEDCIKKLKKLYDESGGKNE